MILKKQKEELSYKQEIIDGLTDDIPLYEKVDIINMICKNLRADMLIDIKNYINALKRISI